MKAKLMQIGAVVAMVAGTIGATPVMARDHWRGDGYYGRGGYDRGYDRGNSYNRGDYYRGGDNRGNYYRGSYDRGGYDRNGYRGYRGGYRCQNDGTTGTIVGAVAGGLLGNQVAGRRGDRTAGTIIGGAVGALAGRAIDKGGSRC